MKTPYLRTFQLKENTKPEIFTRLDSISFNEHPILIDITTCTNQDSVVEFIEDYIETHNVSTALYPICIYTNQGATSNSLFITNKKNGAPRFFKQTSKQLNLKENNLLSKIHLLQKKIYSLNLIEAKSNFSDYSEAQKKINQISRKINFINHITQEIEKKNE